MFRHFYMYETKYISKKIINKFRKNGFIGRLKNVTFKFQFCYDLNNP